MRSEKPLLKASTGQNFELVSLAVPAPDIKYKNTVSAIKGLVSLLRTVGCHLEFSSCLNSNISLTSHLAF